jgi:hypothetical protein
MAMIFEEPEEAAKYMDTCNALGPSSWSMGLGTGCRPA